MAWPHRHWLSLSVSCGYPHAPLKGLSSQRQHTLSFYMRPATSFIIRSICCGAASSLSSATASGVSGPSPSPSPMHLFEPGPPACLLSSCCMCLLCCLPFIRRPKSPTQGSTTNVHRARKRTSNKATKGKAEGTSGIMPTVECNGMPVRKNDGHTQKKCLCVCVKTCKACTCPVAGGPGKPQPHTRPPIPPHPPKPDHPDHDYDHPPHLTLSELGFGRRLAGGYIRAFNLGLPDGALSTFQFLLCVYQHAECSGYIPPKGGKVGRGAWAATQ